LFITGISNDSAVLARIENNFHSTMRKVDVIMRTTAAITFRNFDAYDKMTETSAGKTQKKQEDIRKKYYDHCGISDDRNKEGTTQATCVLTGRSGKLKLAHLLPASADSDIQKTLRLSNDEYGVWSLRNVMLLSWNIEYYFDRKKLSFIQSPLYNDVFILKIWDSEVRDSLIFDGAKVFSMEGDNKIGFYENRQLQLIMPNGVKLQPFKRCLSYQAFVSFYNTNLLNDAVPSDFGSDNETWLSKREDMLVMRKSLEKEVVREVEEEEEYPHKKRKHENLPAGLNVGVD
jgi:hypothetical protein